MYTVYQTHREGELLLEDQWVKVRGELEYGTGGTSRYRCKTANVLGADFKPLLLEIEHAVVTVRDNGHIGIEGVQTAAHERGIYWAKQRYPQVWLCVPFRGESPGQHPQDIQATGADQ
jgi:hypothetical protein